MNNQIGPFDGNYYWLSNEYSQNCRVYLEGDWYPSAENAFQASKFLWAERDKFKTCSSKEAMELGKNVKPLGWFVRSLEVMEKILESKFSYTNIDLVRKLLDTGDVDLVNLNLDGDTFWGVCEGKGENMLGQMLMNLRDKLRANKAQNARYSIEDYTKGW